MLPGFDGVIGCNGLPLVMADLLFLDQQGNSTPLVEFCKRVVNASFYQHLAVGVPFLR